MKAGTGTGYTIATYLLCVRPAKTSSKQELRYQRYICAVVACMHAHMIIRCDAVKLDEGGEKDGEVRLTHSLLSDESLPWSHVSGMMTDTNTLSPALRPKESSWRGHPHSAQVGASGAPRPRLRWKRVCLLPLPPLHCALPVAKAGAEAEADPADSPPRQLPRKS